MTTAVAIFEPLPVPTATKPMPTLPTWVSSMAGKVKENWQPDGSGNEYFATLKSDAMPTAEQRFEVEKHRAHLVKALDQTPENSPECDAATMALVAEFLDIKPGRDRGEQASKARLNAFRMALESVPTWSVRWAIKRWHLGEGWYEGLEWVTFDWHWAPEPSELRRAAMALVYEVEQRIKKLDAILSAVPYRDTKGQRARNQAAFAALIAGAADDLDIDQAAEVGRELIKQNPEKFAFLEEN
jgi:hypothetical protein